MTDLYAAQVMFNYDAGLATANRIEKGDLLKGISFIKKIDPANNKITYVESKLGRVAGVSGEGCLMKVNFTAENSGELQFVMGGEAIQLVNSQGQLVDYNLNHPIVIIGE